MNATTDRKEQLEKLASEFPERFSLHYEGRTLLVTIHEPTQILNVDPAWWSGRALLLAALVDLVEEAGLKLYVDPHGWWMDDPDKIGPLSRADCDTALSAVLAAAPEIKRRLEEAHAGI